MQLVLRQVPGIVLLANVNADRIFSVGTVVLGLFFGAWIGDVLVTR